VDQGHDESNGPRSLGGSLDEYLASQGLTAMRVFADIVACWERVVGPDVARHVRPRSLTGQELRVAVDHPGWATQLAFLSETICDRLADQLGYRAVEHLKGYVESGSRLD
jgi:predicted nucleic acid-binding Zn ribbon protein